MTKSDFIPIVMGEGTDRRQATAIVNSIFETMATTLESDQEIKIFKLFRLFTATTAARMGRNPQTNQPIQIPSKRVVRMKVAPSFKNKLNP